MLSNLFFERIELERWDWSQINKFFMYFIVLIKSEHLQWISTAFFDDFCKKKHVFFIFGVWKLCYNSILLQFVKIRFFPCKSQRVLALICDLSHYCSSIRLEMTVSWIYTCHLAIFCFRLFLPISVNCSASYNVISNHIIIVGIMALLKK